ncbi:MAG: FAD-dependent oxidoreductase [Syntrophobacteraceae bacterium]
MSRSSLVIVCTCHNTLSSTLPKNVLEDGLAVRMPGARLVFATSLCRPEDIDRLNELIAREQPSHQGSVLLAACSPFARGRAVLDGLEERGCPAPALVDIREGCAWIHANDPATVAKAVDLICMGVAGLSRRATSRRQRVHAERRVLVVGAGPAGLAAAGALAGLGVPVTMVERLGRPGGLINQIGRLFPHNIPSSDFLTPLLRDMTHPLVDFLPKTSVKSIEGEPGRFEARMSRDGQDTTVIAGAVILACGAMPVLPEKRFRAGELSGVISQLELETRLKKLEQEGAEPAGYSSAVFIQCIAARDDTNPYCSTICCPTALKNGLRLKHLNANMDVTVLHRGIMAPGRALEDLYRQAMAAGVRFIGYSMEDPPEVQGNGQVSAVTVVDALSGRRSLLPADLVVLSTPLKPRPETSALAKSIGVRLDEMGFACGCEPMQPLITPVPGVYLCGAMRWPVYAEHAVDQGRAAAAKAAGFLGNFQNEETGTGVFSLPGASPSVSSVRTEACSRCGQCVAVCPYGACRRGGDGTATVSEIRCRGCGLCTAVCPSGAAHIPGHNAALRAMVREIAQRVQS